MAQVTLNPAINELDTTSTLYDLYTRFYDGMTKANSTDTPQFVSEPIYKKNEDGTDELDADGAKIVDTEAMAEQLSEYSTILIKNSAYMMANAIVSTIDPDGGSSSGTGGTGFVTRSGDTMQGSLGALYGFEAGFNNTKIFETTINADDKKIAIVTGSLQILEDVNVTGNFYLSNNGIYFGDNQTIWYDQTKLNLASQEIGLTGEVSVDGSIKNGSVTINKNGIWLGSYEYYHGGNSNNSKVDWTMRNAYVANNLQVTGSTELRGELHSKGGFTFSIGEQNLFYTKVDEDNSYIILNGDLSIINNNGIKFDNDYIIWVRKADNIVSFSAPNAIMNLGDKSTDAEGNEVTTKYIALQADIKNYNGAYNIVTHDGSGNFPNGFSVGVANALEATFQTYYISEDDYGLVSKNNLRFGSTDGPAISGEKTSLNMAIPYIYVSEATQYKSVTNFKLYAESSSSLVYNPTSKQSILAMCFNTDAAHFSFNVPVEAKKFAIKSTKYKTQLEENALFFSDGVFIEGIKDGMRLSQNSMFDGNLYSFNPDSSSISFSSGFAGSGWAIMEDNTSGGIHATFDCLTIRKKMRVYELEVQKISVTNGSLWVSDSCSGDEVRELN